MISTPPRPVPPPTHSYAADTSTTSTAATVERVACIAGGALLAFASTRARWHLAPKLGLLAAGGTLLLRGITGRTWSGNGNGSGEPEPLTIHVVTTVDRPRQDVYEAWRRFEEFPAFMRHLAEVRSTGDRSHWVAPLPGGHGSIEWDAETTADEPGSRIAWRSLPDSSLENAGEVRFYDAPGDGGTEVHARISYRAPAGALGRAAAGLLNRAFANMVAADVRRFKSVLEAREVATIEGQTRGTT